MNWAANLRRSEKSNSGAPIKALLLFFAVWLMGRILLDGYGSEPELLALDREATSALNAKPAQDRRSEKVNLKPDRNGLTEKMEPIPPFIAGYVGQNQRISAYYSSSGDRLPGKFFPGATGRITPPVAISSIKETTAAALGFIESARSQAIAPNIISQPHSPDRMNEPKSTKPPDARAARKRGRPLSGYFWIFARQDGFRAIGPASFAPGQFVGSSYGGSQAGSILSYRFAGDSKRHLSTFARVSTAFRSSRLRTAQEEAALGLKVKPWKNFPVTFHAEQRLALKSGKNRGQAVYLAGGAGPSKTIAGLELESYAQAGYLFGKRDSYFFDGSVSLQKPLIEKNRDKLMIGVGSWTGGQRNVRRVDIGPRAEYQMPLGQNTARVSIDWRQKIAGNASPGSGLALTFSTGF